jgi:RHS repeat-associated protein
MVNSTQGNELIWASTTYNVADQPLTVAQSAGGGEAFQYDGNSGRMTQWDSTAGSLQQVGTLTWNANGTLRSLQVNDGINSANTQTCTNLYDDLSRLTSNSCASGWGQAFGYDVFGNITKAIITGHSGLSFQPTYAANNRISSVPGATITYDNMGNMTADNLSNTYSYDAEGRPSKVNNPTQTLTYFDALGRAVDQTRAGVYTQIVYSPSGAKFVFMHGTTLIKYIDPMVAGMAAVHNGDGSGYFQHSDWLGSSRLAVRGDGTVPYDRAYAPFGEPYDETATTNRDFTGPTEDTTAGVYDFLFRQQSQSQGRWLVPDPAGLAAVDLTNPQTWNRYAYVGNIPDRAVDSFGLRCTIYVFGVNDNSGAFDSIGITSESSAYPYSDLGLFGGLASAGFGSGGDAQGLTNLLTQYQGEEGGVDLVGWSGGAQTISTVLQNHPSFATGVASTTYLSPGLNLFVGQLYKASNNAVFTGSGILDFGATLRARITGVKSTSVASGHKFVSEYGSGSVQSRLNDFRINGGSRGVCTGGPQQGGGGKKSGGSGLIGIPPGYNNNFLWNLWLNWYLDQLGSSPYPNTAGIEHGYFEITNDLA